METISEAAALASIVTWSETCCPWQRDALRRLYAGRISEADIEELVAICKGQGTSIPLSQDHIRDPRAAAKPVSLICVHAVENVNALAPRQTLSFDRTGMTVIYGENGAGKSGYIRILKKVCRARSPKNDKIEANVYASTSGPQRARVKYSVDGQNEEAAWEQGAVSSPALSSVSVFDSRTATVHVDETNNVAYTPLPMKLLEELAQVCGKIKDKLKDEIAAIERQTPAALKQPKCDPNTKVGQLMATLSEKTKPTDVATLAAVTPEEKLHCEALQRDLASNPAAAARSLEALRTRLRNHTTALKRMHEAVAPERRADLAALRANHIAAQEAANVAAGALFGGEPLAGVGSEVWRTLWESARAYSIQEAYPEALFPVTDEGARCVLCQQEISGEGAARLIRFEDFVKDQSKKREADALAKLNDELRALRAVDQPTSSIRQIVSLVRDELQDESLAIRLRRIALATKWRLRAMQRLSTSQMVPVAPLPENEIAAHDKLLQNRAEAFASDANSVSRRKLVAECSELADRLWLQVQEQDVLTEIGRRKQVAALRAAQKDTNPIRITSKSDEIAEQLITNTLRSQFVTEVDRIGVSHLSVELRKGKTTYGAAQYRVALIRKPDAVVGDVLSEGEHRSIAIAAFMAELATTESKSAIVFDDPVSSLDHLHRENIADRLAAESLRRQVIVFTHDIAFLFLLKEACWKHEAHIGYRTVARNDDFAGFCHTEAPANARPVSAVIEAIQSQLTNQKIQYERADMAAWERTVKALEQQLRETWERVVEEAVSPVLYRLGSKVNTPGLSKLTVIELEDCRAMREAYGRCSRLLHSMPGALNPRLPRPQQLQDEIDALRNWYTSMTDRQAAMADA